MARALETWSSEAADPKRGLRGRHWLMLLLSVLTALGIAAPSLLSQPSLYTSAAEVTLDTKRYGAFFDAGAFKPSAEEVKSGALTMLRGEFNGFGTRYIKVEHADLGGGRIRLTATTRHAEQAGPMAEQAAIRLAQYVRAAGGRDLLRALMNYELYAMTRRQDPAGEFEQQLRELLAEHVFAFELQADSRRPQLTPEDFADVTRALEVREDELSVVLNHPQVPREEKSKAVRDREVLRALLIKLQPLYHAEGSDTVPSAAYVSALPSPTTLIDNGLLWKSIAAALAGLGGGILAVLVDRAVGIVRKLRELWSYRELMRNLVTRDLKARYKGSWLGYFWSLLNPLLMITIFYVVFRVLLRSNITHFHIFLMAALLPWNYTVGAISEGIVSITANSALVKKVYFPREILPIATVLSNLISFLLALPVLFLVILLTGAPLGWTVLFVPVIIVIQTIFLVGLALTLSSTAVFFRDTQHIVGILLQLWFFLTPVFYSLEDVAGSTAKYMRWVNPMASLIDFYRDLLYGGVARDGFLPTPALPALDGVARTFLTALLMLAVGVYIFHHTSERFAEEL